MKKLYFSLIVLLLSLLQQGTAQCSSCTFVYSTSSSSDMSFTAGTYCFTAGTFTGNINSMASGVTICIGTNASFKPQNINGGLYGTINVYGECVLPNVSLKADFKLNSYGKTTFSNGATVDGANVQLINSGTFTAASNFNFNGAATYCILRNKTGGVMTFSSATNAGDNALIDNSGKLQIGGDFNLNYATSTFYNSANAETRVAGNFYPQGKLVNDGLLVVNGYTNVSTAASTVNNCRFVSVTGFTNNTPSYFTNNGLLWAPGGKIQNNAGATFDLGTRSVMRGTDFGNDGTVKGSGKMHFTGSTTQQGSFNGTSAAAPITFYDASPSGSLVFDYPQQNQAYTNTVRVAFTPADTSSFDCTGLILPVQLTGFDARPIQNKAVLLTWQSQTEAHLSRFIIERASAPAGSNWETAGSLKAAGTSTVIHSYQLTDSNPLSGISYYRLRSVEIDGKETVSAIRQVNLSSKVSSLAVYPTLVQKGGIVKVITAEPAHYQLLDMSGRVLAKGPLVSGANLLSLKVNTGNYLLETLSDSQVRQHSKIIVQ